MASVFTDEQIVEIANRIIANNKYVSRGLLRRAACTSEPRLLKLEAQGLIKLPPKVPKGAAHFFHREKIWRKFTINSKG